MKTKTNAERRAYIHDEIIRLYGEGWTLTDISNELNESIGYVNDVLIRKRLKKKKKVSQDNKENAPFILKDYDEGKAVAELALKYSTPPTVIYSLLKTHNRLAGVMYNGKRFGSMTELSKYKKAIGVKLREEYRAGATRAGLMEKYGLNLKSVSAFLLKYR